MPELYSRTDDSNWLTPSIADILEQGAPPPGGDGSIREYMLAIQKELADLETPAKIVNVRSMPSYTLYVARPETIGRLGNRRLVQPQEIRRSLAKIAESHPDWLLGFIPKLQEDESSLGILLRTNAHRPLSLRRLLVRGSFRAAPANYSFALGITLEQNLIVRDLATLEHLLVVGSDNSKNHFLRAMLLTLILLNTPSELRLINAGRGVESVKALIATPHSLGRIVNQPDGLVKILEGLQAEFARRQLAFEELQSADIDAFNLVARTNGRPTVPRILMVIDSLADTEWDSDRPRLERSLAALMTSDSARLGIHFVVTIPDHDRFKDLQAQISTHIVMRNNAKGFTEQILDFHPSLMRFVDAIVIENSDGQNTLTPVELCSTSNAELIAGVTYWQQTRQQRTVETRGEAPVSGRTGVTDLLTYPQQTIARVTDTLPDYTSTMERANAGSSQNPEPFSHDVSASKTTITDTSEVLMPNQHNADVRHAIALAAYLGWLSTGALIDIFGLNIEAALSLIAQLKEFGYLEHTDTPTARFITNR